MLEASHSFLWFRVNSFAGSCRREESLSAAGMVASKQEQCVGPKILLVARAGDILSSGLSGVTISNKTFQRTANVCHKDLHSSVCVLSREVLC